jgi:hypothetical protein
MKTLPLSPGQRSSRRSGAILGVVMIVVVLMAMIGTGLMHLGTSDGIETVRAAQHTQAFWLAEAGVQETIASLLTGYDMVSRNQGSPTPFGPTTLANGTYQGTVWRGPATSSYSNYYNITSTGLSRGVARSILQTVRVIPDGYGMSFYSNAVTAQTLTTVGSKPDIDGTVSCLVTNTKKTFTFKNPPDIPPPLDTSGYDAWINNASTYPPMNTATSLSLSAATPLIRVGGDLTLTRLSSTNSGGALVASGNVVVKGPIGNNVTLYVGGTLTLEGGSIGSNCLIYAGTSITVDKVDFISGNQCAMLTPGTLEAKNKFTFYGLLYAGAGMSFKNDTVIDGAIVCGGMADLAVLDAKNKLDVNLDPSQFPVTPPPGLGGVEVKRFMWQEI